MKATHDMEKTLMEDAGVQPVRRPSPVPPLRRLLLLPLLVGGYIGFNAASSRLPAVNLDAVTSVLPSLGSSACRHGSSHQRASFADRAHDILAKHPLIDGHNDLLISLRTGSKNHLTDEVLKRFGNGTLPGHTDIPRIQSGGYGGAFWSAFYLCQKDIFDFSNAAYDPIVRATFEQIDVFHRLSAIFPQYFTLPYSAESALDGFHANHTLISPLAIEGLHQIGNSPSILRSYYELGVRYATLNWNCHNQYSDAAVLTYIADGKAESEKSEPYWGGVTRKGRALIKEMNRLGMMVDLSHVSADTMRDVLVGDHNHDAPHSEAGLAGGIADEEVEEWTGSLAPPIFSHSSAYALCPHPRNPTDSVLQLVKKRNSVVMINFNPGFIACTAPPSSSGDKALPIDDPANATLDRVVEHIMHIGDLIGYDHVGIGSDFNGIEEVPKGMEDVSKFPDLVAELLKRGVSEEDVIKVLGGNILRVWREVEKVAIKLQASGMKPLEDDLEHI